MKQQLIHIFLLMGLLVCSGQNIFGQDTSKIYKGNYDIRPVPPEGDQGCLDFLGRNIKYPKKAKKAKAEGTVFISVVVEKNGTLSNIQVEKDNVGYGCAEESIKAIQKMSPWIPAKVNGKPVRCQWTIPIKFSLDG